MKLHLGCGNVILPGFVNVDAVGGPGVDVVDDVRFLTAFPDECASLIYASHVLDHMGRHEVPDVLATWRRVLRPGRGGLRLAVSDFAAVVRCYLEGIPLDRLLGHIVGGQKSLHDRHGIVFDQKTLRAALAAAGFIGVEAWDWRTTEHADRDDFSQAYEPHMDKTSGRLMSLNVAASASARDRHRDDVVAWVIGDSHAPVFAAGRVHPKHLSTVEPFYDRRGGFFGVRYVGPWLAWRLDDKQRLAEATACVRSLFAGTGGRPLIFTLGEIDCRTRLARPAEHTAHRDVSSAVEETVERYTSALARLRFEFNVPVAAYDPPLPTYGPIYNAEFPANGSYAERRHAADVYSAELARSCTERGLGFLSIHDRLADGPERTRVECYSDSIHLNPDVVYDAIRTEAERWLGSLS